MKLEPTASPHLCPKYGAPISTFTRTITLALHHLNLPYIARQHLPHSPQVREHNPLGLIPVLIHRPHAPFDLNKDVVVLYESAAVKSYLDDALAGIAAGRRLGNSSPPPLTPPLDRAHLVSSAHARATVSQISSLAATSVFPALEPKLIKVRQAMEGNGADEESIKVALEEGMDGARSALHILEGFLEDNAKTHSSGPLYFVGNTPTWADLYVYPILADLAATPEGRTLLDPNGRAPKVAAWVQHFAELDMAKKTYPGSVPDLRKKEGKAGHQ